MENRQRVEFPTTAINSPRGGKMDIFTKKAEEIVSNWQRGEPMLTESRRITPLLIMITEALEKSYKLGRFDKASGEN